MKNSNKSRSIHKLLCLILEDIVSTDKLINGLCSIIRRLYFSNLITNNEFELLRTYVKQNRPKSKKFYDYSWIPCIKTYRIKWLKKHIQLTKTK